MVYPSAKKLVNSLVLFYTEKKNKSLMSLMNHTRKAGHTSQSHESEDENMEQMKQTKLIEKILTNKEYCEKIAEMTLESFREELTRKGVELNNIEKVYNTIKISVAGGELSDDELETVAGGVGMCDCKGALC